MGQYEPKDSGEVTRKPLDKFKEAAKTGTGNRKPVNQTRARTELEQRSSNEPVETDVSQGSELATRGSSRQR
ncbi:hypothetical protein [Croceicoccus naphthovorans]|uniref:hypothetical protein n=1 Tax=Croceicoccus naphthovorans TaxID=1348774 RepID=UPI000B24B6AB|nr:hypothetical protein [Croceicoccus naphthovorans]MBB3991181.1 hypothetical protein [Croceicoccus naphthovorans]